MSTLLTSEREYLTVDEVAGLLRLTKAAEISRWLDSASARALEAYT